jgi:UPF0176 protein
MNYEVLLFYKYVTIDDPEIVRDTQRRICEQLGLKGRILIAPNGVNGTVEGIGEKTSEYISQMNQDPRFADIVYKKSEGSGEAFPKLQVKVRKDLVSDHTAEWGVDPRKMTGKYLSAEDLHAWIKTGKKFYIMDMRNDYEHKSGHFENAILPQIETFRDLPKVLPQLKKYDDRPIVTVCTGGIRCERASALLLKYGFQDVYQLQDGIVTYMEKYPNEDFKGKLYVFDNRILMGFETKSPQHEMIGRCVACGAKSENYINCSNDKCHRHLIICEKCLNLDGTITCPQGCRKMK